MSTRAASSSSQRRRSVGGDSAVASPSTASKDDLEGVEATNEDADNLDVISQAGSEKGKEDAQEDDESPRLANENDSNNVIENDLEDNNQNGKLLFIFFNKNQMIFRNIVWIKNKVCNQTNSTYTKVSNKRIGEQGLFLPTRFML